MFHLFKGKPKAQPQRTGNQLFKRSLALAAGLLLLWLALTIRPKPSTATHVVNYSNDAGAIAHSESSIADYSEKNSEDSGVDWGKLSAGVLLAGLIGFAFYWQKKSTRSTSGVETLQTLGKLQLTPNQHLYLVGCGSDALLIGNSNSQITLLHQLPIKQLEQNKKLSSLTTAHAPSYSTPSSTAFGNPDFGVLLQQQRFTLQNFTSQKAVPAKNNG